MDGSVRRWRGGSPERSKRRAEAPPPKQHQHQHQHQQHRPPQLQPQLQLQLQPPPQQLPPGSRIPVVYYLCRNNHLEHPHFIEVPLVSPDGLYLRDVISRLNVLRGKRMAARYSWSCKRSYKNGFVWQDLCEDDLIHPVNGNEYVLKGSELLDASPSDRFHHSTTSIHRFQNGRHPPHLESPSLPSRSQDSSPSSSTVVVRESTQPTMHLHSPARSPLPLPAPREDTLSPNHCKRYSYPGDASPESSKRNSSEGCQGSPGLVDYKLYKASRATDASTQTEERTGGERSKAKEASPRDSLAEGGRSDSELSEKLQGQRGREITEVSRDGVSPPPPSSSTSSSCGKLNTLESLIRAEARKMNSFRILEDEEILVPTGPKLKATNMLMQLITCGSISVKGNQSFGLVHKYNPRVFAGNLSSPMFHSSRMLGELDCVSQNPRFMGLKTEDEGINGSIFETRKHGKEEKEVDVTLKRSSSYNADSDCRSPGSIVEKEHGTDSPITKCLPKASKTTSSKHSKCQTMRSPVSDSHRISYGSPNFCQTASPSTMNGASTRFTGTSLVKVSPTRLESYAEDTDKVFQIEERLASGARVIIQSVNQSNGIEGS